MRKEAERRMEKGRGKGSGGWNQVYKRMRAMR